jgi:hypothetical protein
MPTVNPPLLIELWGAREDRLNRLEEAIKAGKNKAS